MASQSIGILRGALTGTIYAVINPDDDAELDNPRLLLIRGEEAEPIAMVRVARDDYMAALTMEDVAALVERLT